MSIKWYAVLIISIGALNVAPAYGMGRWFRDFANSPQMRGFAENVGRGFERAAKGASNAWDSYKDGVRRRHKEHMEDLAKKASDMNLPKWQRDAAREELLHESQKGKRSEEQFAQFTNQALQSGLSLGTSFLQGAINEGLSRAAHERELQKAGLEAKIKGKAIVESTKETLKALLDPQNLGKVVLSTGGVFAMYFGLKHGIVHIADQYRKPALADPDKTSLKFGPVNWLKSVIYGTEQVESSLSDVILKPELALRVNETVQSLKNTVKNGGYLKNIMLWGQPGTGKTMLAMRMARSCGLEYIYFAASNLEPFTTEEASAQLVQLFRYAHSSPKKLMIIIDEAEALLGSRGKANVTDKKKTLLNLVLAYTGTESRDYMVTILTNRPEDIDEAFLSRCDERVQIGAPEPTERRAILQLYVDKILKTGANLKPHKPSIFSSKYWFGKEDPITPPAVDENALTEKALDKLSNTLDGFVGRDISKLVIQIQSSALATEDNKITTALINRVVQTKLNERKEAMEGFIRDGFDHGAPAA